jgi:hypothetical protein
LIFDFVISFCGDKSVGWLVLVRHMSDKRERSEDVSMRESRWKVIIARTGHREVYGRHRPHPRTLDWAIFDRKKWSPGS